MRGDILDVINAMIDENSKSLAQIAEEIGKPYPTLKRELNEFDDGAKLGVMALLPLMRVCDSTAPLEYLAARMGCRVVPLDDSEPNGKDMDEECLRGFPAVSALVSAIKGGATPYTRLIVLHGAARKEIDDIIKRVRAEQEQGRQRVRRSA